MSRKKILILGGLLVAVLGFFGMMRLSAQPSPQFVNAFDGKKVTVYKSLSCGCCGNYVAYLKRAGFDVETQNVSNMDEIKTKYGVPADVQTCHTTVVDGYFVEGHVPLEAIAKLLSEKPAIAGIGLPGMPSGSPGMPGGKTETWDILSIGNDGLEGTFLSL